MQSLVEGARSTSAGVSFCVARVIYGAVDMKAGALGSLYNLGSDPRLNHGFEIAAGVRAVECAELLSEFFADRRD